MARKIKLGVLTSSGDNYNLESILENCQEEGFPAEVATVITDGRTEGLELAEEFNVPSAIIRRQYWEYLQSTKFEARISEKLHENGVWLICLVGFLQPLSDGFINHWNGNVINMHPTLLLTNPANPNKVIGEKDGYTGCSVYWVTTNPEIRPKDVVARSRCIEVYQEDTATREVWYQGSIIYPQAIRKIAEEYFRMHPPPKSVA